MAIKKLNEGYTEFASTQNGYFAPFGVIGRFFTRFFARGRSEDPEQEQLSDPIKPLTQLPPKPLHGDTVTSKDVIRASQMLNDRTRYPILPQQEYDRKTRYKEYEDMDTYPEIGSAFDIYADDCTQENLDGSKWDIITKEELVKEEVSELFKQIDLGGLLWDIVRNTVKYGENFIELVVDINNIKKGIQRIKILNPNFLYRVEDEFGYLRAFFQEIPAKEEWVTYGGAGPDMANNQVIPLDPAQIVHFRLHTSDPQHYPYGKGIAYTARSTYRKMKMMEDAMLIYRLSRAPERRIFYIDTGSLPSTKAEAHLKLQMDKLKKSKMYNRSSGNIEEAYNAIAPDEDFYIAVNGKGSGTKIETLPGAENLGEVDDVKYFRDKLLAALKIPKDYVVEKDQAPERKANLSQLDVKFARVIVRIQESIERGLEILAKRHLMIKGFPTVLIKDLVIKLPAPSDMSRKRQLDLDEQKARVVQAVKGLNIFPMEKIYKDYYQLNDNEIERIKDGLEKDRTDPAFAPPGAGAGPGMPGMPAAPGGPPPDGEMPPEGGQPQQEPAENIPPTQNENISDKLNVILENHQDLSEDAIKVLISLKAELDGN